MKILTFDPSGNWGNKEGMGTTGWAVFDDGKLIEWGHVSAEDYKIQEDYWYEVGAVIGLKNPALVVCESYNLQGNKAKAQSGSSMDTPQLIGFLRMICYYKGIQWFFQHPQDKARVTDPILVREGFFEKKGNRYTCQGKPTIIHERDAIRHGIYYLRYNKGRD